MVNLIARAPRGGGGEGFCLVIVREEFQFYTRLKFHLRINTPSFHTHFFRLSSSDIDFLVDRIWLNMGSDKSIK